MKTDSSEDEKSERQGDNKISEVDSERRERLLRRITVKVEKKVC